MIRRVLMVVWLLALSAGAQELEITIFEGGEGLEFYKNVGQQFERENPGVEVLLQGDPAIADKMRMRVLEGDLPEVTNAGVDIWGLQQQGYLQPLDPWLDELSAQNQSWRESFLPGALSQYERDGKTYGIPLVYVVWSVYYNKTLFREKGWQKPETWPQFFQLCETMKAEQIVPVAFQGRYPFYARPLVEHTYFHLAGPAAHQALAQGQPGAFDHPAMTRSLETLAQLSGYFQPGFEGSSHTEAQMQFFQGRAAMLFCGSWLYSEMRDNIPDEFELGAFQLPLPLAPTARPGAQYASSGYFFVFQSADHPELGAAFLRKLTSPEVAGRFAAERGIPVAVESANSQLNPAMAEVARQLESVQETFGPAKGPTVRGLDQVWNDTIQAVLSGSVNPGAAARRMEEQAEDARKLAQGSLQVHPKHPKKAALFVLLLGLGLALATIPRRGRSGNGGQVVPTLTMMKFLTPSLVVFSLFFTIPSVMAMGVSLFRWDGLQSPEFVGLYHLKRLLLESDLFWSSLWHNLILMVVPACLVLPLSLYLANLLHQEVVGARLFRIAFFFPNLLGVAGVLLWQQLYNPQIGPINRVLVVLGFQDFRNFAWLSNENLYYALIPMAVWAAAGFHMVLYLAAMQSVPESLYEAAELSGADAWQKFRYITLPLISETLAVSAVLMVIGGMKAFEAIWLLTNQAPSSDTHVVGTFMVQSLFVEQRIGQAAALAVLLFVVVLVGSVVSHRFAGGEVQE